MNNKKRILVMTSTFPRWKDDVEPPFVFELCKRLAERYEIIVSAPHAAGAEMTEEMSGVHVKRYAYAPMHCQTLAYRGGIIANLKQNRVRYLLLPIFLLAQGLALYRILKTEKVDLIHAHWLIPQGLIATMTSAFIRKGMPPVVCTSHGGDLLGLNGGWLANLKRWVIGRLVRMTVVSNAMVTYAQKLGMRSDQLKVISMGVDTQNLFTSDFQTKRADSEILYVGRLVEKKGVSYLIQAMRIIIKKNPHARLIVVGDGPERKSLENQVRQMQLGHAISFNGAVNNEGLPALYRHATVLVAPSIITTNGDQEGLGMVLVEALACGCAVVASDLPAFRDVISPGVGGVLVPPKNVEYIASAVLGMLDAPDYRREVADAGRLHVKAKFDWSVIALRYSELFDEAM